MILPFDALETILNSVDVFGKEKVSIFDAQGRVAADFVYSKLNLPSLDNSAMDGYAVKFEDIKETPAKLKLKGTIKAGDSVDNLSIENGECYRIMTGAFVPKGADTVVEFEVTKEENSTVEIIKQKKTVCQCEI